jgi:dihydrolipoamide dehydrogenase
MARRYDIAVIGSGPGGYVAALRAAQLGASVACIEREWIGGVCLNEGCIPTKALLRSAEVYALVKDAATFGVVAGTPSVDWSGMQARKEQVVKQMVGGVTMLLQRAGVEVIRGEAILSTPTTLSVRLEDGQDTVVAERVIVATGSRTMAVPIPGLDGPAVINHRGALELESLPDSLAIIGGGVIGCEYASLFAALGVDVTVIEMLPRLVPLMDAAIGEGLAWSLGQRGVAIHTGTRVTGVTSGASGARVSMVTPEGEQQVEAQWVLSAIGRSPNVENLGLEALGIKPTRKGIQTDHRMRTAVPGLYAIGDVAAEGPMLAHVASHQGIVAVEDALLGTAERGHGAGMDYRAVPSCVFTIPEAAAVGMTEEEARTAGYEVQVGVFALPNNGKAVTLGETEGFVKVVAEAEHGAVLGMHVMGPHASDLVLEGTMAVAFEATLDEMERTIHPHPTLGEAIGEAALAARGRALHLPKPR